MPMSYDEILTKVKDVLMDALGADEEEITPQAKLVADLGAESIDFLDISFRLEKAFGFKVQQGEWFPEHVLQDAQYVNDGKITDQGLVELKKKLPFVDLTEFSQSRKVEDFAQVFTVDALVKYVQGKVGA